MRDAHRMKERFDLSLDNRQVVSLLIGGLIVLGAVFVLGVVVGKKLAGSAETRHADDILSALDRKAEQPAPAAAEVPLTFQDELTRKQPEAPSAAPATRAAESKPAPPHSATADAATAAPAHSAHAPGSTGSNNENGAAALRDLPGVVDKGPAEPSRDLTADADESAGTVKAAPPAPRNLPAGAGKVKQTAVATRAAQREGAIKEAVDHAAPARPPRGAVTGGAFTLQLSSSQSREEADRFAAKLRDRGYAPYLVKAEVPGRGTWYRVRMGSFPTKTAAQKYLADFKRETQLSAIVAPSK